MVAPEDIVRQMRVLLKTPHHQGKHIQSVSGHCGELSTDYGNGLRG
jgi:hypothetical protein